MSFGFIIRCIELGKGTVEGQSNKSEQELKMNLQLLFWKAKDRILPW